MIRRLFLLVILIVSVANTAIADVFEVNGLMYFHDVGEVTVEVTECLNISENIEIDYSNYHIALTPEYGMG